jgi:hypothetical protein
MTDVLANAGDLARRGFASIDTQLWEPDPEKPGVLRLVRDRTIREVFDDLRVALGEDPQAARSTSWCVRTLPVTPPWPKGHIAVWATRGANEGDYVHVDVLHDSRVQSVLLAKTFHGRDAAWAFARNVADLLGI